MSLSIERVGPATSHPRVHEQVRALCDAAYGEDLAAVLRRYRTRRAPSWMARSRAGIASHVGRPHTVRRKGGNHCDRPMSSSSPRRKSDQGRRFATRLMERLALEIQGYDIGALSPAETTLYQRLGWERWHGALSVRTAAGVVPTPGEELMVLRLPGSPPVDLEAALSVDWRAGEVW